MTFLRKLFSRKPAKRVRICVECGMPIGGEKEEHKDWCSIIRTRLENQRKAAAAAKS